MINISSYLMKLHSALPVRIRNIYSPVVKLMHRFRMFFLKLYIIEGVEASSEKTMKMAYFGLDERILNYWLELLYTQNTCTRIKSFIPIWKVRRHLINDNLDYDLVIVELNDLTRKAIALPSGFVLPRWLDLKLNPSNPLNIKQLDTILRRIRKYKLTFERRYVDSDLRYFYDRMYKPYISVRHKKATVITDYKNFQYMFSTQKSRFYFILRNGEPVAGAVDIIEGKNIRMGSIGVLDGREDLLKMGVVGACYYFRIMDYKNRKIEMVNFGGTSPVLTDGLTQFKLSFGTEVMDRKHLTDPYIMILPINNSIAVKSTLKSNPFLYLSERSTYQAIFFDSGSEDEKSVFLRVLNLTDCKNIKETVVYCFNEVNNTSGWFDKELYKNVRFINYKAGDEVM